MTSENLPDTLTSCRISLENIQRSATVIDPVFLNSPQYDCEPLSDALGCHLTMKLEFLNPIRSFKGRGASFMVSELRRQNERRPLVCASAGNWGQAMAYVCRSEKWPLVMYAAESANSMKVERMKALGADVRQVGRDFDEAKDAAKAYAKSVNGLMVEDGFQVEISEGHGTIAIELLARGQRFDAVVVPLGNGALLNGVARWMKFASPETRVVGVCAQGADAMEKSWRENRLKVADSTQTIADGIGVRVPIAEALRDMSGLVDEVLLVSDEQLVDSMRKVHQHTGLMLEPAGAAGVAALLAHQRQFSGLRVATVLCGSNLTAIQMGSYFGPTLL
jgi:threonine dehydratase